MTKRKLVQYIVTHIKPETAVRLNRFLKTHDPYEYRDNDMSLDKVEEMDPNTIINYLLDVIEEMEE